MNLIKESEWNDGIADASNWKFFKLDRISRGHDEKVAPTTVFVVRADLMLLGFEKVSEFWKVDERDLMREDIKCHPDPEEAYVEYIKANFAMYLEQLKQAVTKWKLYKMGLFKPKPRILYPEAVDYQHEKQLNNFKNQVHERKQRLKKLGSLKKR